MRQGKGVQVDGQKIAVGAAVAMLSKFVLDSLQLPRPTDTHPPRQIKVITSASGDVFYALCLHFFCLDRFEWEFLVLPNSPAGD
jgi:hypothetical protein